MKRLPIRTLLVLGLICVIGFGSGIFQDLISIYRTKIQTARIAAEKEQIVEDAAASAIKRISDGTIGFERTKPKLDDFETMKAGWVAKLRDEKASKKQIGCILDALTRVGNANTDIVYHFAIELPALRDCGFPESYLKQATKVMIHRSNSMSEN